MEDFINLLYAASGQKKNDEDGKVSTSLTEKDKAELEKKLLETDTYRRQREPYTQEYLLDPEKGVWDLHDIKSAIPSEWNWVSRDPHRDVKANGIVAIDFGTKSTVVAFRDGKETRFMRIGKGKISDAPTKDDYENPTAMHFLKFKDYYDAYKKRKGRPMTNYNDLSVSHTALNELKASDSAEYREFLMKLKQWAGNKGTEIWLKIDGSAVKLEDYLKIEKAPFDPLELYAYNIGLAINNMDYGVFLEYYMSFPVTYEKAVIKKIKESFEKGIKKSLPVVILEDKELMSKFCVHDNISEPQAYAACVLQEYEIDPDDYSKPCVFYGIFDFGGGTTDFNFGLWRNPSDEYSNKDYEMVILRNDGLPLLGGENLLEQLAFEIFKENHEMMRKGGYQWTLPLGCSAFPGSETLLDHTQTAEKNMKNLIDSIRKYWEDYQNQFGEETGGDEISITVDLYSSKAPESKSNKLEYSKSKINEFFTEKVTEGINSYFIAQENALAKVKASKLENDLADKILIFLAGNSCKSPLVQQLFYQRIEKESAVLSQNNIKIELYPPLGTKEACEIISKNLKKEVKEDDLARPTGKTGVAYGLIECRKAGPINFIALDSSDETTLFKYYVGKNKKRKFYILDETRSSDNNFKLDYGKWYLFAPATGSVEIYYSDLPVCSDTENPPRIPNSRISYESILVPEGSSGNIYIRAVTSDTLEYVISDKEPTSDTKGVLMELKLD